MPWHRANEMVMMGRLNWFSRRKQKHFGDHCCAVLGGACKHVHIVAGSLDLSLEHVELKTRG